MDREYLAMLVESNTVSAYDSSEPSTSTKEAHIIDAQSTGASALHATLNYSDNQNSRCRMKFEKKGKSPEKLANEVPRHVRRTEFKSRTQIPVPDSTLNPPKDAIYIAKKGRALLEGLGSLGSRALHIKARVHSMDIDPIRAHLDSGADITLMSEDYYKSIPDLPKIKEGLRMKLYHLTGNALVLGYIQTSLFATSTDGTTISFKLEAYVVRGMRVPLLIGEDFQTTFELGLVRHASGHNEVLVG